MERDCFNCRFELRLPDEIPCIHCGIDGREYWLPKAKTNADRIRAMTDEELAKWNNFCPHPDEECSMKGCEKCILEWLQQPAEGDA